MVLRHLFPGHFHPHVLGAVAVELMTILLVIAVALGAAVLAILEVEEPVRLEKEILEELAQTQAPVGELVVAGKAPAVEMEIHLAHPETVETALNG
jgi:hypothetical protein